MQRLSGAAARKERRRQERLEKKGQEAAHRVSCFLARLLHKECIKASKIARQPEAPVLFRWGLWKFAVEGKGFYSKLYGFHPKYGWWYFTTSYGWDISASDLKRAGLRLEEAGTNV